jgi:hypothetical protein
MPCFMSIPVAQGDAFYLRLNDFSALIDGGRSQLGLPIAFQSTTNSDGVNVAVCTHNDADHANGILGFLRAGLRCDEIWLPGRWLSALPDLLRPFNDVLTELADNIADTNSSPNMQEAEPIDRPIEMFAERSLRPSTEAPAAEEGPPVAEDGWPEAYLNLLELADLWDVHEPFLWPHWHPYWHIPSYSSHLDRKLADGQLLWSAIDAASRIRAIAIEAYHRGIPARWFEFDTSSPSGGSPNLIPVNARQITRARPRIGTLLAHLALSVSNRESLVFWSLPTKYHPGVLFTADSDLAGASLPAQLDGAIVTAPHHGSDSNAHAYQAVTAAAQNGRSRVTWVRSDGRFRSRPGIGYLGLASRRLCTLCRIGATGWTRHQTVRLYSRGGRWIRHRDSRLCTCR